MALSEIASNLDDEFVIDDLQAEISKTVDGETDTIQTYTEAVLSYENVVKHPLNDDVYIPQEERDKITIYSDLDRDDRVEALRMLVARKALQKEKREWAVDYTDVQELFKEEFHGEPSDDYAYTLMEEASEVPWMQYRKRQSRLKLIIPDLLEVPKNILEDAADDPDVDINPRDLLANDTEVDLQETRVNIELETQGCELSSYSVSPAPVPKQEAGADD
jgi:hypothetical protein